MRASLQSLVPRDGSAWRALAASFVMFGGVGVVLLFAAPLLGMDREASLKAWLATAAQTPWGLLVAVLVFAGLAFLGVPQVALIAAAAVAFGPLRGAAYSWVGTLVSAMVGFGLGRWSGAGRLEAIGGHGVKRFMALIARNGFTASLLVRLAPSGPFILVNMAAGVTAMTFVDFLAGTAIGIVPKIALTAMAGRSLVQIAGGGGFAQGGIIAISILAWIGLGLLARAWLKREATDT